MEARVNPQLRPVPALIAAYDYEIERPQGRVASPELEQSAEAVVVAPDSPQIAADACVAENSGFVGRRGRSDVAVCSSDGGGVVPKKKRGRPSREATKVATSSIRSKRSEIAESHQLPEGLTPIQIFKCRKTMVDHTYRDFSRVLPPVDCRSTPASAGIGTPQAGEAFTHRSHFRPENERGGSFPAKLHDILSKPWEYGEFIAWRPHGRAFVVLEPKILETKILGSYFGHNRYSTFLRQLNEHGFKLLAQGEDRGSYYNEAFLRGLPHLVRYMPPPKISPRRLIADPENEPDLNQISKLFPLPGDSREKTGTAPTDLGSRCVPAPPTAKANVPKCPVSSSAELSVEPFATKTSASHMNVGSRAAAVAEAMLCGHSALRMERVWERDRGASVAAASFIAAQRRRHQLDLAKTILFGTDSAGMLYNRLPLPSAASTAATIAAAFRPAAGDPSTASIRSDAVETEAFLRVLASNAAAPSRIIAGAAPPIGLGLAHLGRGPSGLGGAVSSSLGAEHDLAAAAFELTRQKGGVDGVGPFFHRWC